MMWNMNPWSFEQHKANAAEQERRAREHKQGQDARQGTRSTR
jgi:hypothetical protein